MISCQGRGDKREDGRCLLRFPCEMEGREQAVGPSPRVGERGGSHFMNSILLPGHLVLGVSALMETLPRYTIKEEVLL